MRIHPEGFYAPLYDSGETGFGIASNVHLNASNVTFNVTLKTGISIDLAAGLYHGLVAQ